MQTTGQFQSISYLTVKTTRESFISTASDSRLELCGRRFANPIAFKCSAQNAANLYDLSRCAVTAPITESAHLGSRISIKRVWHEPMIASHGQRLFRADDPSSGD